MAKLSISDKPVSNIPVLPVGTYPGVVSAIWDVGTQKSEYQGEVKIVHQLLVRVEVSKTIDVEGEYKGKRYAPISWITVPKSYSDLSNLVKLCNAAYKRTTTAEDYKDMDTDDLLGKNVTVTVGVTSGGKAKITAFSPAMDGMKELIPELGSETPDWVQNIAAEAIVQEGQSRPAAAPEPAPEDDLPF